MAESDESERSLNRRQLLKRSAIVGGIAWTAPLIVQSITAPAGAQVSPVDPGDRDDDDERDREDTSGSGVAPIVEPVPPPPEPLTGQATFTG